MKTHSIAFAMGLSVLSVVAGQRASATDVPFSAANTIDEDFDGAGYVVRPLGRSSRAERPKGRTTYTYAECSPCTSGAT